MIYMVYTRTPHVGRDFPFGSLAQEFEKVFATTTTTNYPPYNIAKISDDKYVMEFAVAGFKRDDISVTTEKNVLSIKAEKTESEEKNYVYKGIAARKFNRAFTLPEYFEVESAGFEDGILYIDLIRNIPEEKKPKTININ
jgi:molecular chaperone IbpA